MYLFEIGAKVVLKDETKKDNIVGEVIDYYTDRGEIQGYWIKEDNVTNSIHIWAIDDPIEPFEKQACVILNFPDSVKENTVIDYQAGTKNIDWPQLFRLYGQVGLVAGKAEKKEFDSIKQAFINSFKVVTAI